MIDWLIENTSWKYLIWEYIRIVGAYWWAMFPGFVMPLRDLFGMFKKLPRTPRPVVVATLIFFLSIAQFLAFRNARIALARVIEDKHQLSVKAGADAAKLDNERSQLTAVEQRLAALDAPEPADSLRRRTMRLADKVQEYLAPRAATSPPFVGPDSRVPNPTDEQKRAIEKYQAYWQETDDYYSEHFKDAMVGIIREYEAKGVRTGFLESSLSQRPPYLCPPPSACENTPTDELYQFRELAYHVDGQGHLITVTP